MIFIDYPEPQFKLQSRDEKTFVFDAIRKTWLVLTPEEWVRQNFVHYLIHRMQYPSSLIALEKEIFLGDLKKRFDILVYNKSHQPWMLVECKAATVPLNDAVVNQVLRYQVSVPVSFLVITNGNSTYGWCKNADGVTELNELPSAAIM